MKFSVWPSPSRSIDEVFDLALTADASGWFGFWFADHYMPNTGDETMKAGDVHEVWSVLPAVAALTESIRIGSLVSPTSVHHPAVLANRTITLDHVSNGRMVLGLGAGWQINEHRAYGIELEAPKQRVDRFEESIQVIRSLLDEDRTTFDGTYYSLDNAPSDPSPVQAKLPILVGTSGPRMCRITARYAQEWNAWGAPDVAAQKVEIFSAACERVGVDIASKHRSVQALFTLTDDQTRIDEALAGPMGDNTIAGSDGFIADAIGQYVELGFDEVIVPDFALGESTAERSDAYERFMTNIVPQIS
jgi:alkanesulfonate monooxygenase SsuD/methylene tetrahydromethanopterin reductase-like flavin-dependent oxidoreductase (luciferase family)